jgi:Tol biopolymer transport system component
MARLSLTLVPLALAGSAFDAIAQTPKGKPILVSRNTDGDSTSAPSYNPSVSANGRFVAFRTRALELVGEPNSAILQVVVADRETGTFERISRDFGGGPVNGDCFEAIISADGRYVTYDTTANDVTFLDSGDDIDIFRYDRETQTTVRVSVADSGSQANADCGEIHMSSNGRYVVFTSEATNLDGTNGFRQVYLRDMVLEATALVSMNFQGDAANDHCGWAEISDDGQRVVFLSGANNLGSAQAALGLDSVWLRDFEDQSTSLVSKPFESNVDPNGYCISPTISPDGRYIAFASTATNLVPNDPHPFLYEMFFYDSVKDKLTRIAMNVPGLAESGYDQLRLSKNAKQLVFRVTEPGEGNNAIAVWTRAKKTTKILTKAPDGDMTTDGNSTACRISGNGKYVVFQSTSTQLGSDANAFSDVFLFRR